MKTFLAVLLALSSSVVAAQPRQPHHHYNGVHRHVDVVTPVIVGTVIGYVLSQASRNNDQVQVPPPVIVQQQPQVIMTNRPPQPVFEKVQKFEPSCGCYVEVWIQTGWR